MKNSHTDRPNFIKSAAAFTGAMAGLSLLPNNSWANPPATELDFLLDDKANTIGALAFPLAATDAFYHEQTFKSLEWGKWDKSAEDKFGAAMELGDTGRKKIKGNTEHESHHLGQINLLKSRLPGAKSDNNG